MRDLPPILASKMPSVFASFLRVAINCFIYVLSMITDQYTTREQTLERCPNLALASAFFAPGTKGLPLVPVGNTSRD